MSEFLLPAILNLFDPLNIFLMIAGLAGGIIVGALPGLTATMGVALMVPVTFAMSTALSCWAPSTVEPFTAVRTRPF